MPRMSSLVQVPSRSGWPQAVRGAFQFGSLALAAVVSAGIARSAEGALVGAAKPPPPSRPPPPTALRRRRCAAGRRPGGRLRADERDRERRRLSPDRATAARTLCRITACASGFSHNMSQHDLQPRGRVLLVTGGSRGIGAATARLAAAARLRRVRQLPRQRRGGRSARSRPPRRAGARAVAVQADVAVEARRGPAVRRPATPSSAGCRRSSTTPPSSKPRRGSTPWTRRASAACSRTNVIGAFLCAREAVRRMSTRYGGTGGAIVNVSSGASRHGIARRVHRLRRHQGRARHDDDRPGARGGRRRASASTPCAPGTSTPSCTPAAASRTAWSA